ncbi:MAG: GatB/YqeY domain-containing protein [Candidatus Vogelbacteria bacterium]|nr:GatB/YqeY domain-containing protein [Candidatus Vogelbacteria bacterium]
MLHENIKGGIIEATKARDVARVAILRGLVADFTNELVAKRRLPTEFLSDEEAIEVIKRAVKKRLDSVSQFKAGGRQDLVNVEEAEIALLKPFLPRMMSQDEIRPIAEQKKAEMNFTDKTKSGMLVGAILKELKGKANGIDVKAVVDGLFS